MLNSKVLLWIFFGCFLLGGLAVAWSQRLGRGAVVATPAHSSQPSRPSFPHGGYSIVLQHTGDATREDDLFYPPEATFNIVGIATHTKFGSESPAFQTTSVQEPWLYDQASEPLQTLDILASHGAVWRLQLRVVIDGRDESPQLEQLVGRPVQLHVKRSRFGIGTFAALRLSDADGLLVALDFRSFLPGQDPDVATDMGTTLYVGTDTCGTYETKTLELTGDAPLSLRPGQHATLPIHDQDYEAWNLASTMLTNNQNCTDMFSSFAWFVERHPD